MFKPVTIVGAGPDLAADLYLPTYTHTRCPAVVTASGFGGVKEMLLPAFAEALAAAGVACLLVDYAGFGASAGLPRQHIDPRMQIRDLQRGLDYLSGLGSVDPARLGVWGPSMCGAHALVVAGTDPRVRAAVTMVPFVRAPAPRLELSLAVAADLARRALGRSPTTIAVAGEPGTRAVMTTDGALDWIRETTAHAPSYRNEITTRSLLRVASYRPTSLIGKRGIQIPLRTILATDDTITPASAARAALRKVAPSQDVVEFPGTHFELFGEHLAQVIGLTVDWFSLHLSAPRPLHGARATA